MEELRLILETIENIGGAAYWLFIMYITKGFLIAVGIIGVVVYFIKTAKNLISQNIQADSYDNFNRSIVRLLGYNPRWNDWKETQSERKKLMAKIKKIIK